jgi:uncharacterized protein (TIGR00369 family)
VKSLPHTHSCFVCGESNPLGLQLRFYSDGPLVRTQFTPRLEHVGFKQIVHGGIIATLLDEIMVWACAVQTKQFSYCAEFTVRFQQPLRPGETTIATGELVSNRRNRLFEAKAQLHDSAGRLVASASGKYLPIGAAARSELMTDLIDEAGMFQSAGD